MVNSKLDIRGTGISALAVLDLIARGFTYERILYTFEQLTYDDIFLAAKQAGEFIRHSQSEPSPLDRLRERYLRAYEKWTKDEEELLKDEFNRGHAIGEIASTLKRKPGAISSRLVKLGLLEPQNQQIVDR